MSKTGGAATGSVLMATTQESTRRRALVFRRKAPPGLSGGGTLPRFEKRSECRHVMLVLESRLTCRWDVTMGRSVVSCRTAKRVLLRQVCHGVTSRVSMGRGNGPMRCPALNEVSLSCVVSMKHVAHVNVV